MILLQTNFSFYFKHFPDYRGISEDAPDGLVFQRTWHHPQWGKIECSKYKGTHSHSGKIKTRHSLSLGARLGVWVCRWR